MILYTNIYSKLKKKKFFYHIYFNLKNKLLINEESNFNCCI